MKKIFFIFLFFSWGTLFVSAEELPVRNAGFVPANIWYSKDVFFDGETVRVYTVVFNGSTYDLSGTVEFLDNGASIGKTDFSLSRGGRVRDSWIDWKAKEGKHTISARIIDTKVSIEGGAVRSIVLENKEAGKSEINVDFDTDGDGVGNKDDLDDDNDAISDVDELRNGTDPLKKEILETEKKFATSTAPVGIVEDTMKIVEDKIPVFVKSVATSSANVIEKFRIGEGYRFRLAKEEKIREIDAIKMRELAKDKENTTSTFSNKTEKPFAFVMLASMAVLQYIFEWKFVFYGVSVYLLFVILRWCWRFVRD